MGSVDVAIPNYNYGRYLRACVASVLAQGIPGLRILVMDNASEDDSLEIAHQLASEFPCVEVLSRKTNVGLLRSLNEGIEWARSDYLINLSADDLLPPGALARALAIMDNHDDVVAAFGKCLFFQDGELAPDVTDREAASPWQILPGRRFIEKLLNTHVVTLSPLVRTSAQKRAGHYRSETFSPDFEMWLRWGCLGSVAMSRAPQAIQRMHRSNLSNLAWGNSKRRFEQAVATLDVFFSHEGATLENATQLKCKSLRTIGKNAYWSAVAHVFRGQGGTAVDLFRFAFRHCPTAAVLPPVDVFMNYSDAGLRIMETLFPSFFKPNARR
jgi:glycosyltransferase involved in cell wall biosynthesis